MGLLKTEQVTPGQTVTYHKVTDISLNMKTGAASATLSSWASKADWQNHLPPGLRRVFNFTPTGVDLESVAQAAILSDPYWADAEVV